MTRIKETWSPARHWVIETVILEGDAAVVRVGVTRYLVTLVTMETTWTNGQDEDMIEPFVKLRVQRDTGSGWSHRVGTLYLDQLREVPAWLDDIITRATPRDIA